MIDRRRTRGLPKKQEDTAQYHSTLTVPRQIPVLDQLRGMMEAKTHTVRPGDTLWGISQQHLGRGERWPEIRDLNRPILEQNIAQLSPNDPYRQRQLGDLIHPGQEFRLPMEMPPLSPLQEDLNRIMRGEPLPERVEAPEREMPTLPPNQPSLDRLYASQPPSQGFSAEPMPKIPEGLAQMAAVRGRLPVSETGEVTVSSASPIDLSRLFPMAKKRNEAWMNWDGDIAKLTDNYINVFYAGQEITPEKRASIESYVQRNPRSVVERMTPAGAFGNEGAGAFISRMSEAGATTFTGTPPKKELTSTGNDAADGVADTIGTIMSFFAPSGVPGQAFQIGEYVAWGIAPKLASKLRLPHSMVAGAMQKAVGLGLMKAPSDDPKDMLKGAGAGLVAGIAQHYAGPMVNALAAKLGKSGTPLERIAEGMHKQGTFFATMTAAHDIMDKKPANEVALNTLAAYGTGMLFGLLQSAYSEADIRVRYGKNQTIDVMRFMREVDRRGYKPLYDANGNHTGSWTSTDGKKMFTLVVDYKGKDYTIDQLINRPTLSKILNVDKGTLPRGVTPIGIADAPLSGGALPGGTPQLPPGATAPPAPTVAPIAPPAPPVAPVTPPVTPAAQTWNTMTPAARLSMAKEIGWADRTARGIAGKPFEELSAAAQKKVAERVETPGQVPEQMETRVSPVDTVDDADMAKLPAKGADISPKAGEVRPEAPAPVDTLPTIPNKVSEGVWYTGQQADNLSDAMKGKASLYLTRDEGFARGYGNPLSLSLSGDLKVFDTSNGKDVEKVVGALFRDYHDGKLPYELEQDVRRQIEESGRRGAYGKIKDELAVAQIKDESVFDSGDLQGWLWDRFEYDMVAFGNQDTALLLNPEKAIDTKAQPAPVDTARREKQYGYVPTTISRSGVRNTVRNYDYHATEEEALREIELMQPRFPAERLHVEKVEVDNIRKILTPERWQERIAAMKQQKPLEGKEVATTGTIKPETLESVNSLGKELGYSPEEMAQKFIALGGKTKADFTEDKALKLKAELEKDREERVHSIATELYRIDKEMLKDDPTTSIVKRIKQEYNGIAPRKGQDAEEYRRNVPVHLRLSKEKGGTPADEIASSLGMTENQLMEEVRTAGRATGRTIADYYPEAEKFMRESYGEALQAERRAKKEGEIQGFAGPAPTLTPSQQQQQTIPPTKRSDIVKFLSQELDIPIRVGRYRQRALGIFKTREEVIRTGLANDLPVIAHEVGHYLDQRLSLGSRQYDAELQALGQVTSRPSYTKAQIRKEGVAEFTRLYLTNPADAQKQAPQYYAAFEQKMIANPDIHDVLLQARRDIKNWMDQPAKARVLGSLSVGEKQTRKMTLDRLYTHLVDELRPLQRYVKEIAPGADIEKNPFLAAWLARGWTGRANTYVYHGITDKDFNKIGPSLKEILKPVEKNLDDFRAYIVSKRAIELLDRKDPNTGDPAPIDPGIDRADAEQVVKDLETPVFKEALKKLVTYQDALLQELVDSGMLNNQAVAVMKSLNKNYVPFYRVFGEGMGASHGFGKGGFANLGNPIKTIRGSQRDIIDPLESIIRNTFYLVNVAERNNVGRLIVELAEGKQGAGNWVEKLPEPKRGIGLRLSEIEDALVTAGIDTTGADLSQVAAIFRPNPFPAGKENILTVWRDGEREFYQLEPELYRATLFLDKETTNLFVNLLSAPAKMLRAGATLLPDFMVRNPIRDIMTAMVYSDYGFNPTDFAKGLFHVFKKDDLFWKFQAAGGAHGAMVSLDRDYLQGTLRDLLSKTAREKAGNYVKNPLELLRVLSEYGEMATRLGVFSKGVQKETQDRPGVRRAALAGRFTTLDFARAGVSGKIPNKLIAFFNVAIQGTDKLIGAFKQNPKRSLLRSLLYITLPSVLLYLINRDDERYQELPQWEKDIFWHVLTPKRIWRIPKPFELGVIFGTLPERVMQYIDTQDPDAFNGYLNTLREVALPDLIPTALTGWIEVFTNKSFFTGRPVVPRSEENLPAQYQYGTYTTETAKWLGRLLKISPRKVDHMVNSYSGGLGKYGMGATDKLLELVGQTEKIEKPTPEFADLPVLKAFSSRTWGSSKSIDTFYEKLNDTEMLKKRYERGETLSDAEMAELGKLSMYRAMSRDLSDLRRASQEVYVSSLSAEEKRNRIDQINIIRINIARYALGKEKIMVQ